MGMRCIFLEGEEIMKLVTRIASLALGLAVAVGSTGCSLHDSSVTTVKRHKIMRRKHRDRPPLVHRHIHERDVAAAVSHPTD